MSWAAAATIGAGLISSASQAATNRALVDQSNYWNSEQIGLANTAHQREVNDLRAAGLNPVLSASGSGSAVPTLTGADISNVGEGLSQGISSAASYSRPEVKAKIDVDTATARNLDQQNKNLKAQERLTDAQTFRTLQDAQYPGKLGEWSRSLKYGVVDPSWSLIKSGASWTANDLKKSVNDFKRFGDFFMRSLEKSGQSYKRMNPTNKIPAMVYPGWL